MKKQKTEELPILSALGREETWVCLAHWMVVHYYGEQIYGGDRRERQGEHGSYPAERGRSDEVKAERSMG